MPLNIKYDAQKQILYGYYKGTFTVEEFERQLREIVTSEQFPPDVPAIWDLSETDVEQINWEFIGKLLEIRGRFPARGGALIAVVACADLTFGISRMYAARGDSLPQHLEVFRTIKDAEDWIQENKL